MSTIVVGSRDSRLAVAQAMTAVEHLRSAGAEVTLVTMKTLGDVMRDRALFEIGGKGVFLKELDEALLNGSIDLAVHSLKDMPMTQPGGLGIMCCSPREDARDALVLPEGVAALCPGARIGTSSLRRALQLRTLYPDCEIVPMRGNVPTRIDKLDRGEVDALVLAVAGLKRLGLAHRASRIFTTDEMIPAAGQGILAVVGRAGEAYPELRGFADQDAAACAACERAFVKQTDGGCATPICAHASIEGGGIRVRALYQHPETQRVVIGEDAGDITDAERIGKRLAMRLMAQTGD